MLINTEMVAVKRMRPVSVEGIKNCFYWGLQRAT